MQQQAYIISHCSITNNSVYKNGEQLFACNAENIQQFLLQVYRKLDIDYPKFYKMDNLSKLGFLASEYLLPHVPVTQYKQEEISIVLSNANASLDTDVKYFHTIEAGASPALFVYTLANIVIGEICIRNKFKGDNAFFVFETFNAAFMEQYVNDLFNNNTKLCICGWVDVLHEQHKAVLFLVSANSADGKLLFNEANMNRIFKSA